MRSEDPGGHRTFRDHPRDDGAGDPGTATRFIRGGAHHVRATKESRMTGTTSAKDRTESVHAPNRWPGTPANALKAGCGVPAAAGRRSSALSALRRAARGTARHDRAVRVLSARIAACRSRIEPPKVQ